MSEINKPLNQWLLVRSDQSENRYGPYAQEILKSEGLNGFVSLDLSNAPLPEFGDDGLAVLTRCFLTFAEAQQLKAAVESGLRLVCFQPPWNLVKLFNWTPAKRVLHPGWVRVREGYPGADETLQTHVPIAGYEADGTAAEYSVVADAATADWQESGFPAIIQQRVGAGEVAFFFYDLPKAVARIRFGDPELASLLNSGEWWEWLHASDMFVGHVDERVVHLPQAELHAQLLTKVLTEMCPYPLARLWYFEKPEQRAAANFSSDDDWSKPEHFRDLSDTLVQRGGKATFYLMEETALSDDDVRQYRALGHSFGPHVHAPRQEEEMEFQFTRQLREETIAFKERWGCGSVSLQCHCAPWQGYMSWMPDFLAAGYRLLYTHMNHPKWLNLFMCGAGRPLKFVDESGTIFDCWQQPMLSFDDMTLAKRITEDLPAVVAEFHVLLRAATEKFHTAIGIGSHPVSFSTYSKPFLTACFDLLQKEGVPIYSGDDWCRFMDRRQAVAMEYSLTADGRLSVRLDNLCGDFTLMLPLDAGSGVTAEVGVVVDGTPATSTRYRRLQHDYFFVSLHGTDASLAIDVIIDVKGNDRERSRQRTKAGRLSTAK